MNNASSQQKFWRFVHDRLGTKVILCLFLLFTHSAYAQNSSEMNKPAFLFLDLSFTAHRSDTMNATDFGTDYAAGVMAWTGKKKNIGLSIIQREHHVSFTQVGSSLDSAWLDASIFYRYLWFYPFLSLGHCSLEAKRAGAPLTDFLCNTMGAGLDIRIPASTAMIARVGAKSTSIIAVSDRLGTLNAIGPLQEYYAGLDIYPKLPWMAINVGFRYRSYSLNVAGEEFGEIETGPYVGCEFHYDF